jgi:hypothetical protein
MATEEENEQLLGFLVEEYRVGDKVLLVGDFNAPEVDWEAECAPNGSFGDRLLNFFYDLALTQQVKQPTRARVGQLPSVLDLVVTKGFNDIENLKVDAPWGKSDHATLNFSVRMETSLPPVKYRRHLQGLSEPELVTSAGCMDWARGLTNLEELWCVLKDNLINLLDRFAPVRRIRMKGRPPWCRARLIKATKAKSGARKDYLRAPGHRRWLQYRKARKNISASPTRISRRL